MNYSVYVIVSEKTRRYYIGVTSKTVGERLAYHNRGANRSTKNNGPWVLVYKEEYLDKSQAWKRERQIKSYKGGEAFKKLIA